MSKDWLEQGVPFKGNSYLTYREYGMEFVDSQDFVQELTIDTYTRGQSAATIWFTSPEGIRYPMFLGDFVSLVAQKKPERTGTYFGTWKFVKRGSNYGVAHV